MSHDNDNHSHSDGPAGSGGEPDPFRRNVVPPGVPDPPKWLGFGTPVIEVFHRDIDGVDRESSVQTYNGYYRAKIGGVLQDTLYDTALACFEAEGLGKIMDGRTEITTPDAETVNAVCSVIGVGGEGYAQCWVSAPGVERWFDYAELYADILPDPQNPGVLADWADDDDDFDDDGFGDEIDLHDDDDDFDDEERPRFTSETPNESDPHELASVEPFPDWQAGEPGPNGLTEVGPTLDFCPTSEEQFDRSAAALVRAARVVSDRCGTPLDASFFVQGEDVIDNFVVVSINPEPDDDAEPSTTLVTSGALDPSQVAFLDENGWIQLTEQDWGRHYSAGTDLADVAIDTVRIARAVLDPDGEAEWWFGVSVLSIDEDAGFATVIGEAAPAVVREAIIASRGAIPDDPGAREAACAELGLAAMQVFGA